MDFYGFIDGICSKFKCESAAPALKEGFKAYCEASNFIPPTDEDYKRLERDRYASLVDQIDTLAGMADMNGYLSPDQNAQLKALSKEIYVYGEKAQKWVALCDEILAKYGPKV